MNGLALKIWIAIPLCLKWTIWKECNWTFEGIGHIVLSIRISFLRSWYDWMRGICSAFSCDSAYDFIDCMNSRY
jgi:hypothetical protein